MNSFEEQASVDMSGGIEEQILVRILKETIGISYVDLESKFADLGGDSVAVLIVAMEVERHLDVSLEMDLFFRSDSSSVKALAHEIAHRRQRTTTPG